MGLAMLDFDQKALTVPASCSKKLSSRMLFLPRMLIDLAKFSVQRQKSSMGLGVVSEDRGQLMPSKTRNLDKFPKTIQDKETQSKNREADWAVQTILQCMHLCLSGFFLSIYGYCRFSLLVLDDCGFTFSLQMCAKTVKNHGEAD